MTPTYTERKKRGSHASGASVGDVRSGQADFAKQRGESGPKEIETTTVYSAQ
jgi:hypothetical protein